MRWTCYNQLFRQVLCGKIFFNLTVNENLTHKLLNSCKIMCFERKLEKEISPSLKYAVAGATESAHAAI